MNVKWHLHLHFWELSCKQKTEISLIKKLNTIFWKPILGQGIGLKLIPPLQKHTNHFIEIVAHVIYSCPIHWYLLINMRTAIQHFQHLRTFTSTNITYYVVCSESYYGIMRKLSFCIFRPSIQAFSRGCASLLQFIFLYS